MPIERRRRPLRALEAAQERIYEYELLRETRKQMFLGGNNQKSNILPLTARVHISFDVIPTREWTLQSPSLVKGFDSLLWTHKEAPLAAPSVWLEGQFLVDSRVHFRAPNLGPILAPPK